MFCCVGNITRSPITDFDDYETITFDNKHTLVRSKRDDMYQVKSICDILLSRRQCSPWFKSPEVAKHFKMLESRGPYNKLYDLREHLPPKISGYYVHRSIMGDVIKWATDTPGPEIFEMLRLIDEEERKILEQKLKETTEMLHRKEELVDRALLTINKQREMLKQYRDDDEEEQDVFEDEQFLEHLEENGKLAAEKNKIIEQQKSRVVPVSKQERYIYMIWRDPTSDAMTTLLHIVKRNIKSFIDKKYKTIRADPTRCWFYREGLPIVMTINEQIKGLIISSFPDGDVKIKGSDIYILTQHLPALHQAITHYFETYQG